MARVLPGNNDVDLDSVFTIQRRVRRSNSVESVSSTTPEIELPPSRVGSEDQGISYEVNRQRARKDTGTANSCTFIEIWVMFANLFCVVPYRIKRNGDDGDSELESSWTRKVIWLAINFTSALEVLGATPAIIRIFHEEPNPMIYMQLGGIFSSIAVRITFVRVVLMKWKHLLRANHSVVKSPYKKCISSKPVRGGILFDYCIPGHMFFSKEFGLVTQVLVMVAFGILTIVRLLLWISYEVQATFDKSEIPSKTEILYVLGCHGRRTLTWTWCPSYDLDEFSNFTLSLPDYAWGSAGFVIYCNGVIIELMTGLGINLLSAVLYVASSEAYIMSLREPSTIHHHYTLLKDISEELSLFLGECLLAYLISAALKTPTSIKIMFNGSVSLFFMVLLKQVEVFVAAILACVASLKIDWIKDRLVREENTSQMPTEPRRFFVLINEIFRTSFGLGYPGLFVLNFRFLFSFLCVEGTFITVIHEVTRT